MGPAMGSFSDSLRADHAQIGISQSSTAVVATIWPLVVGLCWWVGITVMFWENDPIEAGLDSMAWWVLRHHGTETIAQLSLFEIVGRS